MPWFISVWNKPIPVEFSRGDARSIVPGVPFEITESQMATSEFSRLKRIMAITEVDPPFAKSSVSQKPEKKIVVDLPKKAEQPKPKQTVIKKATIKKALIKKEEKKTEIVKEVPLSNPSIQEEDS
jgi:hypothetical protein